MTSPTGTKFDTQRKEIYNSQNTSHVTCLQSRTTNGGLFDGYFATVVFDEPDRQLEASKCAQLNGLTIWYEPSTDQLVRYEIRLHHRNAQPATEGSGSLLTSLNPGKKLTVGDQFEIPFVPTGKQLPLYHLEVLLVFATKSAIPLDSASPKFCLVAHWGVPRETFPNYQSFTIITHRNQSVNTTIHLGGAPDRKKVSGGGKGQEIDHSCVATSKPDSQENAKMAHIVFRNISVYPFTRLDSVIAELPPGVKIERLWRWSRKGSPRNDGNDGEDDPFGDFHFPVIQPPPGTVDGSGLANPLFYPPPSPHQPVLFYEVNLNEYPTTRCHTRKINTRTTPFSLGDVIALRFKKEKGWEAISDSLVGLQVWFVGESTVTPFVWSQAPVPPNKVNKADIGSLQTDFN